MENSSKSPKNKFRAEINFDEAIQGLGSVVSFTGNTIEALQSAAKMYDKHNYTMVVKENKKTYPDFEWVTVKIEHHEAE